MNHAPPFPVRVCGVDAGWILSSHFLKNPVAETWKAAQDPWAPEGRPRPLRDGGAVLEVSAGRPAALHSGASGLSPHRDGVVPSTLAQEAPGVEGRAAPGTRR